MLQQYALLGLLLICEHLPAKIGVWLLPEVEKLQPCKNNNLYICDLRRAIAISDDCPTIPYSLISTLESPEIDDESCIDPDSCEEYINKEQNEELHPILRHKSFVQDFCQGHTLNGCCAILSSNLNVKVGLSTLSDPVAAGEFLRWGGGK